MGLDACRDVVIVGCGFSGAAVTRALLRRRDDSRAPPRIAVIERTGTFGPGYAHAASPVDLLLNVPAARMSIDPDAPADFVDWLRAAGHDVAPTDFVPRRWFGAYVRARLDAAVAAAAPAARPTLVTGEVADLRRRDGHWEVLLQGAAPLRAVDVVLALGNEPPARPAGLSLAVATSDRYVADPFRSLDRLAAVPPGSRVLCLGTGLTMVDVAHLVLRTAGARIVAVSRRGLLPRAHASGSLEGGWRDTIDQLRPHIPAIWRAWSPLQRGAFLRHLRPYWEVHRHRMAPVAAEKVSAWLESGRLAVGRGRMVRASLAATGGSVTVELAGGARLTADLLVNCTGPNRDPARTAEPLVAALLERGVIQRDPAGLGYTPTAASPRLHLVGPACVGARYESTAAPELRAQAALLAHQLTADRDISRKSVTVVS